MKCALAEGFFYNDDDVVPQLQFRRQLAKDLIMNNYLVHEEATNPRTSARRAEMALHVLKTLPKKMKFSGTEMVESGSDYPQHRCTSCKKRFEATVYVPRVSIDVFNATALIQLK